MFTIRQKVFFRTGFVAILAFLVARIGGQDSATALVWALILGIGTLFLQRQTLITGSGFDVLRHRDDPPALRKPATMAGPPSSASAAAPSAGNAQPDAVSGVQSEPPDDLKRIKGIGPKLEEALNKLGFVRFEQIASLSEQQIAAMEAAEPSAKGRAERDRWKEQAAELAASSDAARPKE